MIMLGYDTFQETKDVFVASTDKQGDFQNIAELHKSLSICPSTGSRMIFIINQCKIDVRNWIFKFSLYKCIEIKPENSENCQNRYYLPFCCSFWLKGLLVFVTTDCNVFHLK